jgi:hypothetical protein
LTSRDAVDRGRSARAANSETVNDGDSGSNDSSTRTKRSTSESPDVDLAITAPFHDDVFGGIHGTTDTADRSPGRDRPDLAEVRSVPQQQRQDIYCSKNLRWYCSSELVLLGAMWRRMTGSTGPEGPPLIAVTGRRRSAAGAHDGPAMLDLLQVEVYFAGYADLIVAAGGLAVHLPAQVDPIAAMARLDALVLTGGRT